MEITTLYAAPLAFLFIALSVRTLLLRRRLRIAIGDGGHPEMIRAMRVHANFAEYVPLTLLLVYMLERQAIQEWIVHLLCGMLLVGRLAHAWGVRSVKEDYRFRVLGMALTLTVLGFAAIGLLLVYGWQRVG